jgi:hypothetical protein
MTGSKKNQWKFLDATMKKDLVKSPSESGLSVTRQCELLNFKRTSYYNKPTEVTAEQIEREELIKSRLDYWHTMMSYLGTRHLKSLLNKGMSRGRGK